MEELDPQCPHQSRSVELRRASAAPLYFRCRDAEMSRTNQTCHLVIKSPNSAVSPARSVEDDERQTFHFLLWKTVILH